MPPRKTTDGRTADGKWIDRWGEGDGSASARSTARATATPSVTAGVARSSSAARLAGELILETDLTLHAWVEDWWARHAVPNLEHKPALTTSGMGEVDPARAGSYELRALTPRLSTTQLVRRCGRRRRRADGAVALALLQSILRLAVTEERIASQPVDLSRTVGLPDGSWIRWRPRWSRRCAAPRIAARRARRGGRVHHRVLAYAGLRPQELLALHWTRRTGRGCQALRRPEEC